MKSDDALALVNSKLVNEWQHLPDPVEKERVFEMITTALKESKIEIERISSSDTK